MDYSYLKFPENVEDNFSFLEKEYGFVIKNREQTFVRYESNTVFINIYHGKVSTELVLEIGLINSGKEHGYDLGSLISIANTEEGKNFQFPMTSDLEGIKKGIAELADLLKIYGKKALRADPTTFKELQKDMDRYWAEMNASNIRPQASAAFQKKDYKNAVKLYLTMETCLSASERKKLQYARKKLKENI